MAINDNEHIALNSSPDSDDLRDLCSELKTRGFAKKFLHFQQAGSTNQIASDLARKGYPEGTLVVAEEQTAGRGRWQRPWHSPVGKALLFSLILRPEILPSQIPQITLVVGAAVAQAVHRQTGIRAGIKWPNDLFYQGKKFCGILVEGNVKNSLVLGIGVNVNQESDDFPPQLRSTATSLRMIKGEKVSRLPLLRRILDVLEEDYEEYCRSGFASARRSWLQYEAILGRKVRIAIGGQEYCGHAVGLAEDGALLLRLPQGEEIRCSAGEVNLCREDE
ncbi:MAG: biotin--[acetyl-CoA-carboxylase] ligase [Syntrophaceticus sp.]|nr:biotin--[acetyl-CoA-carboxylase] ligase [Syntrophaceticus sp.]MDD3314011.1 biotin--[acetyl-CoA-carboxylase] ligase [Syntrophaceticus sp.]MDD4782276.1 biotin--[acetyl-CoA-carboxylase] ligase [Syntrophaceticus sp.]